MTDSAQASSGVSADRIQSLKTMANRLRKHSLTSTTAAGSGHPTSCFSCAELVSAVFFQFLRFDVANPDNPYNDRFILSKGHAAPILWSAWAEAGAFPPERLETLRRIDSDLEGHPTPRNAWVDVATGSLGQGLSIGFGMALAARLSNTGNRVFVLLGDGEAAEGSVWEAAELAAYYELDNLIAIVDVNRLGQSQPTMYEHDVESYRQRFAAFGWNAEVVDGHDVEQVVAGLENAVSAEGRPSALIARTLKGKGVSFLEDKNGWHGKPLKPGEDLEKALREIGDHLELKEELRVMPPPAAVSESFDYPPKAKRKMEPPAYAKGDAVATREAYGTALRKLGEVHPGVVALDGDTKNSTYSEKFLAEHPKRFFESFIAEQNMVGAAVGLAALGRTPFASTFACFFTRAYDHIRMAAISQANLKLCGSHAGISIGEDGPSQMGLEDIAMMRAIPGATVFYPSDAVSAERLVELAADIKGIVYIRTSRPKTPILYSAADDFRRGGSKVLKSSKEDRATIVAAGVTVREAMKAYEELASDGIFVRVVDLYCVKPVDRETLRAAARDTGTIITVEDHYPEGGIGDAVLSTLANVSCRFHKIAVNGLPRSGKPEELMDAFGISARGIEEAVRELVK